MSRAPRLRLDTPPPSGPVLFARFAYPPNALGLCGPDESAELFDYASSGVSDAGLRRLARGFDGAWPYLELIAAANRIADPLDPRVVEAYWLGNPLLDRVPAGMLGNSLDERFRGATGGRFANLAGAVDAGAHPHHNFHVFSVYPWLGLLRGGRVDAPLAVLERCRIRWGRVEAVDAERLTVSSRPLEWTGYVLRLAPARLESVLWRGPGGGLLEAPSPGDTVAIHWDWACARLEPARLAALRHQTATQLNIANSLPHPGPAAVLA